MLRSRTLAAGVLTLLAVLSALQLGTAAPASAHAQLTETDPPDGTRLEHSPATIDLTFATEVFLRPTSVQVVNGSGEHVESGVAFHPDGVDRRVAVRLRPDLPDDSYTVRFGIVSDDGHPVSGAFSFVIGAGPLIGVNGVPTSGVGADPAVSLLYGLARWISYCGLAMIGGLVFLATCWPAGAASPRAIRLLRFGWLTALASTVVSLLLIGPYGSRQGLREVLSPSLFQTTMSLPVGKVLVVRIVALLALIPIAGRMLRALITATEADRRSAETLGMAVAIPLLIGYSGAGHAESGTQPTAVVLSDLVHVAAMSVWLGGIMMLLGVALIEAGPEALERILPSFSRVALVSIAALIATGCFQAWQQVGTVQRLWETDYGRVLLVKLVGVALILAAGSQSRRAVRRWSMAGLPQLRIALIAEVALSVLVLLASATLVATSPARLSSYPSGFDQPSQIWPQARSDADPALR